MLISILWEKGEKEANVMILWNCKYVYEIKMENQKKNKKLGNFFVEWEKNTLFGFGKKSGDREPWMLTLKM